MAAYSLRQRIRCFALQPAVSYGRHMEARHLLLVWALNPRKRAGPDQGIHARMSSPPAKPLRGKNKKVSGQAQSPRVLTLPRIPFIRSIDDLLFQRREVPEVVDVNASFIIISCLRWNGKQYLRGIMKAFCFQWRGDLKPIQNPYGHVRNPYKSW